MQVNSPTASPSCGRDVDSSGPRFSGAQHKKWSGNGKEKCKDVSKDTRSCNSSKWRQNQRCHIPTWWVGQKNTKFHTSVAFFFLQVVISELNKFISLCPDIGLKPQHALCFSEVVSFLTIVKGFPFFKKKKHSPLRTFGLP
jgi:hypothetical protein